MPARTNEFQRLVAVLHAQLTPGWTVTESKPLLDRVIHSMREVDVVIEGTAGAYPLILSIECRDRSRPGDVTWVEEMHTKHEHLPTNKLLLVSASGFTAAARKKASALDIELLKLSQAESAPWAQIATKLTEVFLKYVESQIEISAEMEDQGKRVWVPIERATELSTSAGGASVLAGSLVDHIVAQPEVGKVMLDNVKPGDQKDLWAHYQPPTPFLSIDSRGDQRQIYSLGISFHATGSMSTVKLRAGVIAGTAVAFGTADFGTNSLHVSVVEREGWAPSITAHRWPKGAT